MAGNKFVSLHCPSSIQDGKQSSGVQVESDIKPFKGLLMGLFFMSVGMDMQFRVFFQNWATIGSTEAKKHPQEKF